MQLRSDELLAAAWSVRDSAYVIGPTKVGCSVLSERSKIYSGCNVEHRYRSHDVHAEVNAITSMIAEGERRLLALAVVAERERFTPCGACLDWIFQFADPETCVVFCQAEKNGRVTEYVLKDLMPFHPR